MSWSRALPLTLALALLAGCASSGGGTQVSDGASASTGKKAGKNSRYEMDSDAYPDDAPDVSAVPDEVPRVEPYTRSGNRSEYEVWGKTYHVMDDPRGYVAEGTASWYGKKFHGYATASGEIYDMYTMTAAHKSLPLPTYARVTNLDNGKQVIVKVNDRGPFHEDRLIDLSYSAAWRLDMLGHGTGHVRVETLDATTWKPGPSPTQGTAESERLLARSQAVRREQGIAGLDAMEATGGSVASSASGASVAAKPVVASAAPSSTSSVANGEAAFLQVAAVSDLSKADSIRASVSSRLGRPTRVLGSGDLYKVQVGPLEDNVRIESLKSALADAGYAGAFSVTAER
ncbi:MAG: septal ring lytic transglycosylase RlpA [Cobetia sp.]|jgi:rare lipoprotein A|uniref:septal ring lytic transglycosylase RlpA family protein n=1 Tax=Cobetia TaxID=204286 RepID=UPI000C391BD3|nr:MULTISPECIES: septal ring lytic transglycosylase RlpA family protein [Cobetia]MBF07530.1 septal ring lytic transglycosylase RlpA [Cobetia sp.]MBK10421.1 septal ring lytic transglycosylase RlpA [Cobetia sp.]WOI26884.1 septal ring lytic transglycosylase RlpA family protein [Cobetia amphilecti]HAR08214.1 septal ring lytic transglycosylase RlpA [Cobetia sp.]HBJ26769.1 septal ring lytic transglycosylase RlpA [Cobetia sp.]|tara:strand:+ start:139869 stop:140900 length:1032 start_codon:yes stop_codon:yes gene_type:complete